MRKKVVASFIARDQEFQLAQAADAEAAARRLGLELEVLFAEENAIAQIHQLFQAIKTPAEERPAAFVLEPVKDEGMERLSRNAAAAGIGWLALNRSASYLSTLRESHPKLPICSILTDQVEAGRIQGRQIRALLPSGGTVLYVHGPAMTLAEERRRGTEEVLGAAGIRLHSVAGNWTDTSGEKAALGWLHLREGSSGRIDLVACQNDLMALGAYRGLRAARPEGASVPILGMDGLPQGGQRLVRERKMTATVVLPCNAGLAVETVAKWLSDGVQPPERLMQVPHSYPPEAELQPQPRHAS